MTPKLAVSLALIGLALIFVIQNAAVTEVHLLFWTVTMSRALLIFFLLVIGVLIGWLLRGMVAHRRGGRGSNT